VVDAAIAAGVGATIDVKLGGKHDDLHGAPIPLTATVKCITDGRFTLQAMLQGFVLELGPSCRLRASGIDIVVTSKPWQTIDTEVFLLHGIDVTRLDLPWHECPWRPRMAIAATVSINAKQIRLLNAHVDPHAAVNGQLAQLETLIAEADKTALPSVILGDFNTLSNEKCRQTRGFLESRGYTTSFPTGTATWRGGGLLMHADWIFTRGVEIERWGVAKPLNVSDHWPIWAEIVV